MNILDFHALKCSIWGAIVRNNVKHGKQTVLFSNRARIKKGVVGLNELFKFKEFFEFQDTNRAR